MLKSLIQKMSLKDLKTLASLFSTLLDAIKSNKSIDEPLKALACFNQKLFEYYGEFKNINPYIYEVTQRVQAAVPRIKADPNKYAGFIAEFIEELNDVKHQGKIRDYIVKTYIRPVMKQLDFRKKGNTFTKQDNVVTKMLKVYSSMNNTFDRVSFTLELFVSKDGREIAQERVGFLKHGKDVWYELTPKVDPDKLGKEIQKDILEYVPVYFAQFS